MPGHVARRVRVHGRVQGVFFRDSTRRQAVQAGVSGWVRNVPDGTVEAHLEGPDAAVERVVDWMRQGPPRSRVERCDVEPASPEGHERFRVRG